MFIGVCAPFVMHELRNVYCMDFYPSAHAWTESESSVSSPMVPADALTDYVSSLPHWPWWRYRDISAYIYITKPPHALNALIILYSLVRTVIRVQDISVSKLTSIARTGNCVLSKSRSAHRTNTGCRL